MEMITFSKTMKAVNFGNGREVLFSYKTPVAFTNGSEYFRTKKKWSQTTTKHINKWLDGITAKTVEQEVIDNLIK